MIHIYIGFAIVLILIVLILIGIKYINGDFNYIDEIIKEGRIENTHNALIGHYYIIKRNYQNGRIKIIRKDIY